MSKLEKGKITIIGNRRAISTSKIRKITAIKKKRSEKGSREELLGSNPHSKGELFSRSIIDFLERIEAKSITTTASRIIIVAMKEIVIIIYSELYSVLLIGSQLYLYTK
jgi:hypothetical protein